MLKYIEIKTNMRRYLPLIIRFAVVMLAILAFTHIAAFATNFETLPLETKAKEIFTVVPHPPEGTTGQEIAKKLIFGALRYVKILTVVVAILFITIMGYNLITHGGNEEDVTKTKTGITYAIIALLMISMSDDIGKIFDMETGSILSSPQEVINRVHLFDQQVEIFVVFVKYIIGAYATLMVVRSGIKLMTAGGNDEETSKHKKSIMYSAGGLILIYLGDIFINKVFYKVDKNVYSGITGVHPKVDAKAGVEQIVGVTNFIVGFVGPIAVLMLIVGGIMYATARGEEEQMNKAKRILIAAAIGVVMIFGAFAIVGTVISGKLEDIGTLAQ